MALKTSNPAAVTTAYTSILENKNNWMLLGYLNDSVEELCLHSTGREGLAELKTKLSNLCEVFIAFYRSELDNDPRFIIINYIPPNVSGVRRARALVHSRRMGGLILKRHQAVITVDNLSLITPENIHQTLTNPDTAFTFPVPITKQLSKVTEKSLPEEPDIAYLDLVEPGRRPLEQVRPSNIAVSKIITVDKARKSYTATYHPDVSPPNIPSVPPLPKAGGSLFSNIIRRSKKKNGDPVVESLTSALPPPTPPKDNNKFEMHPIALSQSVPTAANPKPLRRPRSRSLADYAVVSHVQDSDEVVIEPEQDDPSAEHSHSRFITPRGKWSNEGALPSDPAERARRRRELQLQREKEERQALEEEGERQRQIKLEKERILKQETEEEALRKIEMEEELRRITSERRRRERLENEEEERRRQELEERKRLDRERRSEEHQRLEKWRKEQAKKAELAARQAEEIKRKEDLERQRKIQQAEKQVKREPSSTGWITIQSQDALSWKRRYYKFTGNKMSLFRNPKDLSIPIDEVDLRGKVKGLKEWNQGYEELEAIAFSFVVEFKNGPDDHWAMYADSEEDKYKILGLFKLAAGL